MKKLIDYGELLNFPAMRPDARQPVRSVGAATSSQTPAVTTASPPASGGILTASNLNLISTGASLLKFGIALVPMLFGGKKK